MYGVCCALAAAGTKALGRLHGPQEADTYLVIEELVPGALAQDPARGFATRFVTAYANDDADTAVGLYKAARHAGVVPFTESVHALLATVASLTALALEETAPGS